MLFNPMVHFMVGMLSSRHSLFQGWIQQHRNVTLLLRHQTQCSDPSPGASRSPALPTARLSSPLLSSPSKSFSILLLITCTYSATSVSLFNKHSHTSLRIHINSNSRSKTTSPWVWSWLFAIATMCTKANSLFLSDKWDTRVTKVHRIGIKDKFNFCIHHSEFLGYIFTA